MQQNNSGRNKQSSAIARLTVTRKNGWKTIVTVEADATLTSFYKFHRQHGAKRSTKELIRTAGRSEGMTLIGQGAHRQKPGLELILQRLENYGSESNPIINAKLRIIKKRAYKKLISARPDELSMVKSYVNVPRERFSRRQNTPGPIRVRLPISEVVHS